MARFAIVMPPIRDLEPLGCSTLPSNRFCHITYPASRPGTDRPEESQAQSPISTIITRYILPSYTKNPTQTQFLEFYDALNQFEDHFLRRCPTPTFVAIRPKLESDVNPLIKSYPTSPIRLLATLTAGEFGRVSLRRPSMDRPPSPKRTHDIHAP